MAPSGDDKQTVDPASAELFAKWQDDTAILDVEQFTRKDVLEITGLSEAQLKNIVERNLVQLTQGNYPGTGRRRLFSGEDILKITCAITMSGVGFPMRWIHLFADQAIARTVNRLMGVAEGGERCIVTFPRPDGDWACIWMDDTDKAPPSLPPAFQVLEIDQLIDQVLAKLRAAVSDEPIPEFPVPVPQNKTSGEI